MGEKDNSVGEGEAFDLFEYQSFNFLFFYSGYNNNLKVYLIYFLCLTSMRRNQ